MNKIKLLITSLICSTMLLVGCNKNTSSVESSEEPTSSETTSSDTTTTETSSEDPVVVPHTLAEIETFISTAISTAAGVEITFYDSGYGYDYISLSFGTNAAFVDNAAENIVSSPVNTLKTYLPDYLTALNSHFYDGVVTAEMSAEEKKAHDYWGDEDGSTAYVSTFTNEDASVGVIVEGYCYNSKLLGCVKVLSLAA